MCVNIDLINRLGIEQFHDFIGAAANSWSAPAARSPASRATARRSLSSQQIAQTIGRRAAGPLAG